MRIPFEYSQYRYTLRSNRVGTIHMSLCKGEAPKDHVYISHRLIFRRYMPSTADDHRNWSQYVKHKYWGANHAHTS